MVPDICVFPLDYLRDGYMPIRYACLKLEIEVLNQLAFTKISILFRGCFETMLIQGYSPTSLFLTLSGKIYSSLLFAGKFAAMPGFSSGMFYFDEKE